MFCVHLLKHSCSLQIRLELSQTPLGMGITLNNNEVNVLEVEHYIIARKIDVTML